MPKLLTGAEIVFKCLEDQDVEYIFGYPGGAVLPIYDELKNHETVKHILVRHEQGLSLIHISEPTRLRRISYAVFCLKKRSQNSANKVIGILEITKYLNDKCDLKEAKDLISIKTRQYIKRQFTWARGQMQDWTHIDPKTNISNLKKILR